MKRSLLLTLLAPVVAAGSLQAAAVDYLLEIDGIKGESSDDRHAQAIEIQSFSWGSTNSASWGGGGGAGKVSFQDIHCTTKVSKAGPQLLLAGASTSHIPRATLSVRKAGATGQYQEYYQIQLEDVLISSYSQHGNSSAGDIVPTDQFTLNFNKATISYTGLDGTVTTGTAVRTPTTTAPQ
jgi:type VI secretion system secreted protein Hcp